MSSNLNEVAAQRKWSSANLTSQTPDSFADAAVLAEAKETLVKRGIPGRKDEEYKYSDTTSLFEHEMWLGDGSSSGEEISFSTFSEEVFRIVCINGIYQQALSTVPSTVFVCSLAEAAANKETAVENHLGKIAAASEDPFVALNTLHFNSGLFVHVPKGIKVEKPIELIQVFESLDDQIKTIYFPRNLIVIEENASAVFFENGQVSTGDRNVLKNSVTEIFVGEQAHLKYYRLQNEHDGFVQINDLSVAAAANSHVDTNTISMGSSWIRNNLTIRLNGKNSEAHLNGLFITDGKQHMDHHTLVDHRVPHCESNQVYKGVLSGRSTGVFNGKIFVRKDAQKTNAYQSSKNILLSDDATINTKPQLEIYADDVKCSHGSSTGQLDEQAIFYLQARGIGRDAAIQLLIHAFALEVLETIREEKIREYLAELIESTLEQDKA